MDYNGRKLVPYIPPAEYDNVANEFLERYCPDALKNPMPVPIEDIARNGLGLDVQYICLSEELDIYGMTIFTDGAVEVYDPTDSKDKRYHPTQKPSELIEMLIKEYSKEGETILDCFMGSGTTGVACVNTNRHFIGIELDEGYFNIAKKRIEEAQARIET